MLNENTLNSLFAIARGTIGVLHGEIDLSSDDADAQTLIRDTMQFDFAWRTPNMGDS